MNPLPLLLALISILDFSEAKFLKKGDLVKKLMKKKYVREGSLRLVGGRGKYEGNVEIFHKGRWGNICDDEWDLREASIVCSKLGYELSRPTYASYFGEPRGNYLMDNLYCDGSEKNLSSCRFDGWGNHDCEKDEAAGVVCINNEKTKSIIMSDATNTVKIEKDKVKTKYGDLQLRLADGRTKNEGRVEMLLDSKGEQGWYAICGDGWRLIEANVVCKQLGLGFAQTATQNHFLGNGILNMTMSGVECVGNEVSLSECTIPNSFYCPGNFFAGVICTAEMADLSIDKDEIEKSAYLEDRLMYLLQCAMEENCVGSSAYIRQKDSGYWHLETRRLLRFTAKVTNIGNEAFRPFLPKNLWQFHQCHMHFHSMEVFATFDIIDQNGFKIAEGHKASFCLEDNECANGARPEFACANYGDQGISPNCSDIYKHNIDCQWVDISDMETGQYYFKVKINPEFKIPEMRFDNNEVTCNLLYTPSYVRIFNCAHTM
ncbi:lysyl oxidase homolog 2 [Cimex lectularius]|uniref:SRCR domain-containing protein n=1 Tax=Cimex lectularius TaxID=79782 RepID=A0A8I6TIX9_CIMLE|nr:lysyl oxidase homolog 2 [Cimex lectularius]